MRCIETAIAYNTWYVSSRINNNMRCIETEETVIDQATGEDK